MGPAPLLRRRTRNHEKTRPDPDFEQVRLGDGQQSPGGNQPRRPYLRGIDFRADSARASQPSVWGGPSPFSAGNDDSPPGSYFPPTPPSPVLPGAAGQHPPPPSVSSLSYRQRRLRDQLPTPTATAEFFGCPPPYPFHPRRVPRGTCYSVRSPLSKPQPQLSTLLRAVDTRTWTLPSKRRPDSLRLIIHNHCNNTK